MKMNLLRSEPGEGQFGNGNFMGQQSKRAHSDSVQLEEEMEALGSKSDFLGVICVPNNYR